jgi:hypothetical protein
MKLSYRGINYETENSNLEFDQGEVGGKYRGTNWQHTYPRHVVHLRPKLYMQYRGVAYSTSPIPLTQSHIQTVANNPAKDNHCPINPQNHLQKHTSSQIHWESMRKSLDRRLAAAQTRGDKDLIDLLQKESRQLSLL